MAQDWFSLHAPKATPEKKDPPRVDWFAQNAARKPARPEDFMDPQPAGPEGSALGRLVGGVGRSLNPIAMAEGLYTAARHPIDTASGLIGAQLEQGRKAYDAVREGRYSEAVGHAGAAVVPVLGPVAANIGENIGRTGDIAGGVGEAAGIIASFPAGNAAAKGLRAAKDGAAVGRGLRGASDAAVAGSEAARFGLTEAAPAARVSTGVRSVDNAVRWAVENGVPVDVATATGNKVVRAAKAAADSSLGGALIGQKAAQMRAESMAKLGRKLSGKAAPVAATPETAGAAVRDALESRIREHAATADAAYEKVRAAERAAMPDDVPVTRKVSSKRTVDQGFIGHWLADDLNEMGYQAGGMTKGGYDAAFNEWRPGDAEHLKHGIGQGSARVAGTPTQEMFHAAGVSGSRAEIAAKVRRYLTGESNNPRVGALIDAMGEAWDGQRFDFQLLTDETLARTGLKRSDFRSPVTMPAMEAPGASKFFGEAADSLTASGTEPMQLAVPLAGAKDALRPLFDRLMRKKELTGQLMGDEARAATALDAIVSGGDHASLSVVDAALGDLKSLARGAALPELRTNGQGLAAQAVKELEAAVQARAKAAGVWDDLRAGRDATIQKWTTAETLDQLRAEPVQTFRLLTQAGDSAIDKLRDVRRVAPQELPRIGRAYLDDLLDTATAEGGFGREGKVFADWQKLGDETKRLLYPDAALRESLDNFFLVGKKMAENPNPSGSALVGGLTAQGAVFFVDPVTGVATTIAGAALSKALNSPKVAGLLTRALETPTTAPAAKSLAARLRAAVGKGAKTSAPAVPAFTAAQRQAQGR